MDMQPPRSRKRQAWWVLLLSICLTGLVAWMADHSIRETARTRFDYQSQALIHAIEKRMQDYETILRGGVGLFQASGQVSREAWKTYVGSLALDDALPGIQALGYSQMLPPEAVAAHIRSVRKEGFPNYDIRPQGLPGLRSSIVYIEPFDWRNQRAFGFDMYAEPVRREAMKRAMESGQAALSGRVRLVQETERDIQPGFLMYLPVYRQGSATDTPETRRAAILGFVYAPFRAHDLFKWLHGQHTQDIDFELYDGEEAAPDHLLFDSRPGELAALKPVSASSGTLTVGLRIQGRPWTLFVHAKPLSVMEGIWVPLLIAAGGLLLDLLLFFHLLALAREKDRISADTAQIRKLSEAAEQSPGSIIMADLNGRIEYANPATAEMYGVQNTSDLIGLPLDVLDAGLAEQCSHPALYALIAAGECWQGEYRNVRRDGSSYIQSASYYPIRNQAGDPVYLLALRKDVTAEYEKAAQLAAAEERYRLALQATREVIWEWEVDQDIQHWSPTGNEVFGWPEMGDAPIQATWWLEHIHPDDRHRVTTSFHRAISDISAQIWQDEYRFLRANGSQAQVLDRAYIVRDETGMPRRMVGAMLDVTEQKQQAAALDLANEHLLVAERLARAGAFYWNIKTGETRWSPALFKLFGLSPGRDAPTREQWLYVVHPDDRSRVLQDLANSIRHQQPLQHEYRIVLPDGTLRWLIGQGDLIIDEQGTPTGMAGICLDQTAQKTIEEELRTYQEQLEALVQERTQQLVTAMQTAESANVAKSAFLANMSHEIRTPLNAVIATALLMEHDASTPLQKQRLERITASAQHLLGLINDILDFSKVEAGKIELENRDFDLDKVITLIDSQQAERIREKKLNWRIERDPTLPRWLRGDALRLSQILINFVGNAVKFTEAGEISLHLIRLDEDARHCRIRFEVRDTGCGFEPGRRDNLFKPFEQEDASTTRKYGGTGLGLAINERICQLMGGLIGADSIPGQGSCFWVELPLAKCDAPATEESTIVLRGLRALVFGDPQDHPQGIMESLKNAGLFVQKARHASEAILRLETAARANSPYRFLICQGGTTDRNNLLQTAIQQRLNSLRAHDRPLHILLTDQATRPSKGIAGFDGILPRNAPPEEVAATLRNLLYTRSQPVHPPPATESVSAPGDLSRYRHCRILLVEDNAINQAVALDLIDSVGLTASLAVNGEQALQCTREQRFDLILMDMQMPVMNGPDATRAIRQLPGYEAVPIIAMTANAFESDRQACFKAGMNDFLSKPVTPQTLHAMLDKWLGEISGKQQPAPPPPATPALPSLTNLPGLDVSRGLARVRGNQAFYVELLQRLLQQYKDYAPRIRTHLANGETQGALDLVLSLQGAASTLGANTLSTLLSEAASKLNTGTHGIEHELQAVRSVFETLDATLHPTADAPHQNSQKN